MPAVSSSTGTPGGASASQRSMKSACASGSPPVTATA
jgi:hypothetical protein